MAVTARAIGIGVAIALVAAVVISVVALRAPPFHVATSSSSHNGSS